MARIYDDYRDAIEWISALLIKVAFHVCGGDSLYFSKKTDMWICETPYLSTLQTMLEPLWFQNLNSNSVISGRSLASGLKHLVFTTIPGACFFVAAPAAYGSSQARGWTQATAAAFAAATAKLNLSNLCNLCHTLWQHQILSPLSDTRDWTCVLMDASWGLNPRSHNRNSAMGMFLNEEFKTRTQ